MATADDNPSSQPASNARVLQTANWLPHYRREWLRFDLFAGVTLAAYAIPVSLAYAILAGLPPQTGLYCYLVGGVGYAIFGSCRQLAFGPTSAISLILGVGITAMAGTNVEQRVLLASAVAVLVAVIFALAWLLRLSVLVNFISGSILTGFKAGAALLIAVTQLPKLFGVQGGGDGFFERIWVLIRQLDGTSWLDLGLGLGAIALLVAGARLLPGRPIAFAVVVLSLILTRAGLISTEHIAVVGDLPSGLPRFQVPFLDIATLDVQSIRQIARMAFACFLLSYIESVSAARTFAQLHGYEVSPRQELLGLGVASLLVGLWQGYPSAGGLSQSAVNNQNGARTPLSLLVCSVALAIVLLFLTGLFRTLPQAVLAAVVIVAVKSLINIQEFRHLWQVSSRDFAAALVALVGVLIMGILDGVVVAVLVSLAILLWSLASPHVAFLGRIPGTYRFSDMDRHPDNQTIPGLLVFRVEASLLYFNVDSVYQTVMDRVNQTPGLRWVVCDLSNTPYIDVAGASILRRLHKTFTGRDVEFKIVEAHAELRDLLRREGLEELVGHISRRVTLEEVAATCAATQPPD